ncbi:MAG: DNA/RNA non-specific endonuclease [Candidatus Binatia bacterium]
MKKLALLPFVLLLILSCTATSPQPNWADLSSTHVFAGEPQGQAIQVLKNQRWSLGYDEEKKNPAWSAYALGPIAHKKHKRVSRFSVDRRTQSRVKHGDYTNTGYSRGHMAPSYGIYSRLGKDAQKETYLCSNICPQKQKHNGGIWLKLEATVAGDGKGEGGWAEKYGKVFVICGPIYDLDSTATLPAGIAIPDAFYKILVRIEDETIQALAFLIPHAPDQTGGKWGELATYLTSVDDVEAKTSLDFMSDLPDALEAEVERRTAAGIWASD